MLKTSGNCYLTSALYIRVYSPLYHSLIKAIFPGEPGLAGFMELRLMEVVVTTGARRRTKLQSNHQHQQTNTQLLTGRMPFLLPNICHMLSASFSKPPKLQRTKLSQS